MKNWKMWNAAEDLVTLLNMGTKNQREFTSFSVSFSLSFSLFLYLILSLSFDTHTMSSVTKTKEVQMNEKQRWNAKVIRLQLNFF